MAKAKQPFLLSKEAAKELVINTNNNTIKVARFYLAEEVDADKLNASKDEFPREACPTEVYAVFTAPKWESCSYFLASDGLYSRSFNYIADVCSGTLSIPFEGISRVEYADKYRYERSFPDNYMKVLYKDGTEIFVWVSAYQQIIKRMLELVIEMQANSQKKPAKKAAAPKKTTTAPKSESVKKEPVKAAAPPVKEEPTSTKKAEPAKEEPKQAAAENKTFMPSARTAVKAVFSPEQAVQIASQANMLFSKTDCAGRFYGAKSIGMEKIAKDYSYFDDGQAPLKIIAVFTAPEWNYCEFFLTTDGLYGRYLNRKQYVPFAGLRRVLYSTLCPVIYQDSGRNSKSAFTATAAPYYYLLLQYEDGNEIPLDPGPNMSFYTKQMKEMLEYSITMRGESVFKDWYEKKSNKQPYAKVPYSEVELYHLIEQYNKDRQKCGFAGFRFMREKEYGKRDFKKYLKQFPKGEAPNDVYAIAVSALGNETLYLTPNGLHGIRMTYKTEHWYVPFAKIENVRILDEMITTKDNIVADIEVEYSDGKKKYIGSDVSNAVKAIFDMIVPAVRFHEEQLEELFHEFNSNSYRQSRYAPAKMTYAIDIDSKKLFNNLMEYPSAKRPSNIFAAETLANTKNCYWFLNPDGMHLAERENPIDRSLMMYGHNIPFADIISVDFADEKGKLVADGPFSYVRIIYLDGSKKIAGSLSQSQANSLRATLRKAMNLQGNYYTNDPKYSMKDVASRVRRGVFTSAQLAKLTDRANRILEKSWTDARFQPIVQLDGRKLYADMYSFQHKRYGCLPAVYSGLNSSIDNYYDCYLASDGLYCEEFKGADDYCIRFADLKEVYLCDKDGKRIPDKNKEAVSDSLELIYLNGVIKKVELSMYLSMISTETRDILREAIAIMNGK